MSNAIMNQRTDTLVDAARSAEREGSWNEALENYESAFSRSVLDHEPESMASILRWIGTIHRDRGDLDAAADLYEASLAIAEIHGNAELEASALNCLAVTMQFQGHGAGAESCYSRAKEIAERTGDTWLAAAIDQNLGTLANIRGEVEVALSRYESALHRLRGLDAHTATASVLNNMGMANVDLERWEPAETCFDEAFRIAEGERDTGTLGSIELNRAELYLKRQWYERARDSCDRAFEVFSLVASDSGAAEVYKSYGVLFRETGKPSLARRHFSQAIELALSCKDRLLEAESRSELALLHLDRKDNKDALQELNRAHRLFTDLDARREIFDLELRLGRLVDTYLRVVQAWGESIEAKDRYTAGHCGRVADYGCILAEAVGVSDRDLTWFRMGAFLHDVGKTAVPSEILNKAGKLTPEEWELMKRHTVVGDEIVAELDFPWDIRPIVRSHHEHWDGNGYPDGLVAEEIPIMARILCVADVFDALTTERSYRPALPREEALSIMERDAGRVVDPALFGIFRRLITERVAA